MPTAKSSICTSKFMGEVIIGECMLFNIGVIKQKILYANWTKKELKAQLVQGLRAEARI